VKTPLGEGPDSEQKRVTTVLCAPNEGFGTPARGKKLLKKINLKVLTREKRARGGRKTDQEPNEKNHGGEKWSQIKKHSGKLRKFVKVNRITGAVGRKISLGRGGLRFGGP